MLVGENLKCVLFVLCIFFREGLNIWHQEPVLSPEGGVGGLLFEMFSGDVSLSPDPTSDQNMKVSGTIGLKNK